MYFYRSFVIIMMAFAIALFGCGESEIGKGTKEERLARSRADLARYAHDLAYKETTLLVQELEKGSDAWQQAMFTKANAVLHSFPLSEEKIAEARGLYEAIIENAPNTVYGLRSQLTIGRIYELRDYNGDVIDIPKAREAYKKTIDLAGDQLVGHEAALRLAGSYIQTYQEEDVKKGLGMLKERLEAYPNNELAAVMMQYMARTYLGILDDAANYVKYNIMAEEIGLVNTNDAGRTYWRIAELARERLNQPEVAIKYYRKLILEASTSGRAYEAQMRLRAMGVEPPSLGVYDDEQETTKNGSKEPKQATTQPGARE